MPKNAITAAKPTKSIFDPFNSSATGHQRADSRLAGSTSWRDSRNLKLRNQYISGTGGGVRVSDTVGAGSEDFGQDGRLENGSFAPGAKGLRTGGQLSIWESMRVTKKDGENPPAKKQKFDEVLDQKPTSVVNPFTPFRKPDGTIRETSWTSHEQRQDFEITSSEGREFVALHDQIGTDVKHEARVAEDKIEHSIELDTTPRTMHPQIFTGLTIYINGSTAPLISDHRLKYLLSTHGARTSVAFGRRTVTHVVLGNTDGHGRCGGGLAGSKIHKEITQVRGKGIKFVTAAWIVESVNAGKRLPESRFQGLNLAAKGVGSVANVFRKQQIGMSNDTKKQRDDG